MCANYIQIKNAPTFSLSPFRHTEEKKKNEMHTHKLGIWNELNEKGRKKKTPKQLKQ